MPAREADPHVPASWHHKVYFSLYKHSKVCSWLVEHLPHGHSGTQAPSICGSVSLRLRVWHIYPVGGKRKGWNKYPMLGDRGLEEHASLPPATASCMPAECKRPGECPQLDCYCSAMTLPWKGSTSLWGTANHVCHTWEWGGRDTCHSHLPLSFTMKVQSLPSGLIFRFRVYPSPPTLIAAGGSVWLTTTLTAGFPALFLRSIITLLLEVSSR